MPEKVPQSHPDTAPKTRAALRRRLAFATGALLLLPLGACSDNDEAQPSSATSTAPSNTVSCLNNFDGVAVATVNTMKTSATELGFRTAAGLWVQKVTVYTSKETPRSFASIIRGEGVSTPYSVVEAQHPFLLHTDPSMHTVLTADIAEPATAESALVSLHYYCPGAAPDIVSPTPVQRS